MNTDDDDHSLTLGCFSDFVCCHVIQKRCAGWKHFVFEVLCRCDCYSGRWLIGRGILEQGRNVCFIGTRRKINLHVIWTCYIRILIACVK